MLTRHKDTLDMFIKQLIFILLVQQNQELTLHLKMENIVGIIWAIDRKEFLDHLNTDM